MHFGAFALLYLILFWSRDLWVEQLRFSFSVALNVFLSSLLHTHLHLKSYVKRMVLMYVARGSLTIVQTIWIWSFSSKVKECLDSVTSSVCYLKLRIVCFVTWVAGEKEEGRGRRRKRREGERQGRGWRRRRAGLVVTLLRDTEGQRTKWEKGRAAAVSTSFKEEGKENWGGDRGGEDEKENSQTDGESAMENEAG